MSPRWPKTAQDGPEMAPRWSNMAARWAKKAVRAKKMREDRRRVVQGGTFFIVFGVPGLWLHDEHLGVILGSSWAVLGPSWAVLGPSWAVLGHPGAILSRLGAILGSLGPSWSHVEAVLGVPGATFGSLGAVLGFLGLSWRCHGPSQSVPERPRIMKRTVKRRKAKGKTKREWGEM